jgi:hypothetical protein
MTDQENYSVEITGDDFQFKRMITKEVASKLVLLALTGETQGFHGQSPLPSAQAPPPVQAPRLNAQGSSAQTDVMPVSIREFLNDSQAKRNPDKITAIASYLKIHQARDVFDKQDIIGGFRSAQEAIPKNVTRDMNWALKSGWIAENPDEKGKYYITVTGEKAVKGKFPRELVKKTVQYQPGTRKRKKKKQNGEESQNNNGNEI